MKVMKNLPGLKVLRVYLLVIVVSMAVFIPIEAFFLFREARLVSHFIEEDTLLFMSRISGELSTSENIIEKINDNPDLFNYYRVTINDEITLNEVEKETGAEKKKAEVKFFHRPHHKRGRIEEVILQVLSEHEQNYLKKEPASPHIRTNTFIKGRDYYYEAITAFENQGTLYTVTLQRDLVEVYGRFLRLELDALGQILAVIILTTTITSVLMMLITSRRFKDAIVKQSQAVALSYGNTPNLAKWGEPYLRDASDAVIALGKRLEEANERSINALSDVSYYVATHLAEIKQATDLIQYYGLQNDEKAVRSQMRRIESNLTSINEINSTIANLTKLEGSKIDIKPQVYELQDLLNLATDWAKKKYPSYTIENPKVGETKKISIQREHFLLIVEALMQNAVKYSNGDEKKIVIASMDHRVKKGIAQFYVKNWGIGVPKEEESRIFERYYRGSNTFQSKSGVGLGLHMVYKLIKLYDGEITVESVRDHEHTYETTFIITFKEHLDET